MSTNNKTEIALLIPVKSNQTELKQTELVRTFLPSFIQSVSDNFNYTIYVGSDAGDTLFNDVEEFIASQSIAHIKARHIKFPSDIEKGHLTRMWNILFQNAYDAGSDYFYQCGDDILFFHDFWVEASVDMLEKSNGFGVTGPDNPYESNILTQTFVSRKHMDVFGYYFPERIMNYYCDDWLNSVYKTCRLLFKLKTHSLYNTQLAQRYAPDESRVIYMEELNSGISALTSYLFSDQFKVNNLTTLLAKSRCGVRTYKRLITG